MFSLVIISYFSQNNSFHRPKTRVTSWDPRGKPAFLMSLYLPLSSSGYIFFFFFLRIGISCAVFPPGLSLLSFPCCSLVFYKSTFSFPSDPSTFPFFPLLLNCFPCFQDKSLYSYKVSTHRQLSLSKSGLNEKEK